MISIVGLSKAAVLAALYNASRPQGMGFMQYDPKPMNEQEAEALLQETTYFDYLKGRVMKVNLAGDSFEERLYDRDNGSGAAANAIAALRRTSDVNSEAVQSQHKAGKQDAAAEARQAMQQESYQTDDRDGGVTFHLGLKDVAGPLSKKVDEAVAK